MLRFSMILYRLLLRLYPIAHRREYGRLMTQAFRDMAREQLKQHGIAGVLVLWPSVLVDTVTTAFNEHQETWKASSFSGKRDQYTRFHALVVLVPLFALILFIFFAQHSTDLFSIYIICLIAGGIAILLRRVRLIRENPIWDAYVIGLLLGVGVMILTFAVAIPSFGVYRLGLPPTAILLFSLALYWTAVHITTRITGTSASVYKWVGIWLAAAAAHRFIETPFNRDAIANTLSFSYALMANFAILFAAAVSIYLSRRWGRPGLITLMVAVGIQLVLVDPGYYTGEAGRWIDLTIILLPMVVCPAWWLLAKSRQSRLYGTFLLWMLLVGVIAFSPSIARTVLGLESEMPVIWVRRALAAAPYLAAMWLVLRTSDSSSIEVTEMQSKQLAA